MACLFTKSEYSICIFANSEKSTSTYQLFEASLVVQQQRICQPMQEMRIQSLGPEDPLEEGMATHSSILAGESHEQRSLVGNNSSWGRKELDMT